MEEKIIDKATELYAEMRKRGLEIRSNNIDGRDNGLFDELCLSLGCVDQKLMDNLKVNAVSAKEFLLAFLKVAEPFSKMFQEIWAFLANHSATVATEQISVRFGLSEVEFEDVDLERFRRYNDLWEKIRVLSSVEIWDVEAIFGLFELTRVLKKHLSGKEGRLGYSQGDSLELPRIETSSHPMGKVVAVIHEVFQKIIDDYAAVPDELKTYESDLGRKAHALTDLVPGWSVIFSNLSEIPDEDMDEGLNYYLDHIEPRIKHQEQLIEQLIKEATDILDLPFWKYRWHTYEIWCTITSLSALEKLGPEIEVVNGRFAVDGYTSTVIARFSNSSYEDACVMIQEETPVVLGNKKAMKPDLRICYGNRIGDLDNTAAVVEFKQRNPIDKSHVEEVAQRYTIGAPKSAGMIISNYDVTNLKPSLPANAIYLEGFQPCNSLVVTEFRERLMDIVREAGLLNAVSVLLVDISSSMGNRYSDPIIRAALNRCILSEKVEVFFFNYHLVDMTINEFDELKIEGGTDIDSALTELLATRPDIGKLLIVSDGEYDLPVDLPSEIKLSECAPEELAKRISWLSSKC